MLDNADADGNGSLDVEEFTEVVVEVLQDLEDKKKRAAKKNTKQTTWQKAQDAVVESLGETLKDVTIADDQMSVVLGDRLRRRVHARSSG